MWEELAKGIFISDNYLRDIQLPEFSLDSKVKSKFASTI